MTVSHSSIDGSQPSAAAPGESRIIIEAPDAPARTLFHAASRGKPPVLSDYLRKHGVPINTRCGGRGLCESCTCELVAGSATHKTTGDIVTVGPSGSVELKTCEFALPATGDAHLRVPPRAYLRYQPQIVTDYRVNIPCGHDPLYQLQPHEKRETQRPPLGVAIDIGTTTVALLLVDLATGKVLAQTAMFNQQMNLGDDVVTRIDMCARDKAMVRRMQQAVADETILPLLETSLAHAGMAREQVRVYSIAGNTTMLHLVAGIDPTPLGTAPFSPAFLSHHVIRDDQVFRTNGIARPPAAVHLLPSAAAYVGSDLTAGVVASGMLYDEGPSLLVDVGTNGEMILKTADDQFHGCATAAGPAFEGAGLTCGMRAGDGVIAYIALHGPQPGTPFRVDTETIGQNNGKKFNTVGICGSAYIDFLAEARRCGLLSATGRFDPDFNANGHIIPGLSPDHPDRGFRLGYAPGKKPIAITERDIASLLQAKAATAAGVLTLLARTGLKASDIRTVYLAGGFGTKMKAANAIACGLLPGFAPQQIQPVGNTSLAGAYLALLDRSLLDDMQKVGRSIDIIELNLDPSFEDCYIEQLQLP